MVTTVFGLGTRVNIALTCFGRFRLDNNSMGPYLDGVNNVDETWEAGAAVSMVHD